MILPRFSFFCGIDVGKAKHMACLIDVNGQCLARSQSFTNDAAGFALLQRRLAESCLSQSCVTQSCPTQSCPTQSCPAQSILVGMEATGHYWYALHEYLVRLGYTVVVLNPLQTAQHARKGIRKCKTDRVDAHHIATLIKSGDYRPSVVPGELATTCRQLSRLWYTLGGQRTRLKLLIHARLEWLWPEFEAHFADALCPTAQAILNAAPTPADLLQLSHEELTELIAKASRRRLGADLARRLRDSARTSIGMVRGSDGARIAIRTLLQQLDITQPVRKELEQKIAELSSKLPPCILTLPGINAIRAVSLFGETDPITTFKSPEQLVAFAGLDVTVFQTGQYESAHRRISKRGSPYLRRTVWMMASIAVRQEGHLRKDYLRRQKQGLHHLSNVTAAALKLCRITWRILTDGRDYLPEAPAHS
jgi:transposase